MATPFAGHAVDRWNPIRLLQLSAALAIGGMVVSAFAPAMIVVVLGRFMVGCGGAAQYAVSLTSAVRELTSGARARVFAITGFAWVIPAIVGPPAGAIIASTVGWRWALVAPIPLVIASRALLVPLLRTAPPVVTDKRKLPVLATFITAAGVIALLSALAGRSWATVAVGIPAAVASGVGLSRLLPRGTLRAAAGLPAVIAVQFTLNLAYFAGDGFLPLALTSLLGRSLTQAGLALTVSGVAWSGGGWWQSRVAGRSSPRLLVAAGGALILVGALGIIAAILTGSSAVAYVTWTLAGVGMGIAYQTSWVVGSGLAEEGHEGLAVSSLLLAETVGSSLGAGLAGGAVALAGVGTPSLKSGLVAAFLIVALGAAATALLGSRQPQHAMPSRPES